VMMSAVAGASKENAPAKRLADGVVIAIAIVLLIQVTAQLLSGWGTIYHTQVVLEFALPIWLTVGALPFVYLLALLSSYEQVFLHMRFANDRRPATWRVKLALVLSLHVRLHAVHSFAGKYPGELVRAGSFSEARRVMADWVRELRDREVATRKELEDLARYAGVEGTDAEGRQLDRREFKETSRALVWLHSVQMGWHNRDGRYRRDVAAHFEDKWSRRGLPDDHGITVKVSRSGQSWFAWRRTPSGWCFAIGAAGPPTDERFFDGPEPPSGFPGHAPGWSVAFEPTVNWPD
jgi:hypothetical protein